MMTIPSPTEINSRSIVKSELSELKVRHKPFQRWTSEVGRYFWESKFTWNKLQMLLGHISFSARVPLPCCYDGWSELLQEQLETRRSYNKSCVRMYICINKPISLGTFPFPNIGLNGKPCCVGSLFCSFRKDMISLHYPWTKSTNM